MAPDWDQLIADLKEIVGGSNPDATGLKCREIITLLRQEGLPVDAGDAVRVLQILRGKREYDLLQEVTEAFMQCGLQSPEIRKLYAQALLDQGRMHVALPFLDSLVKDTADVSEDMSEHAEAKGLIGRGWKQVYVDTGNPAKAEARTALNNAVRAYLSVYRSDPAEYSWHGINAAALLHRAAVDGVEVHGVADPDWRSIALAQDILSQMEMKWLNNRASMWDCGTALEACVALKRERDAREWLNRYVREPDCDAFELGSSLRQLSEVWQLDPESEPGASLLPILQGELLKRNNGQLTVTPSQLKAGRLEQLKPEHLEKILGKVRYVSYKFMLKAIERARSVARIEHAPGQGFGTGFVVRGGDLHPQLADELLLLTNAHVVSEDPRLHNALRPHEAIVTFQLLLEEGSANEEYAVSKLLWSSPPEELDASLLRLEEIPTGLTPYPIARNLPLADGEQRVYVIGHPKGGSLSFSIEDNQLLDHEAPRIHYRAPTEGGSSGSPVFNAQWKLIGLHHAGSNEMRRLNNKEGVYGANEGLWIQSIIAKMLADPQQITG